MDGDVVTVERFIAAEPAAIFELVADPRQHPRIDGSGAVKAAKAGGGEPLHLGATFGMSMKMGVGYSMVNTVIEFEQDRRIAWQARPGGFFGRLVGGRIWRYELEPTEGGTTVPRELGRIRGPPAVVPQAGQAARPDSREHGEDPAPGRRTGDRAAAVRRPAQR